MREIVLEGRIFYARVLREFSLRAMIVILFPRMRHIDPDTDADKLNPAVKAGDIIELGSQDFRVLWMRRESDDRGGYLATALVLEK